MRVRVIRSNQSFVRFVSRVQRNRPPSRPYIDMLIPLEDLKRKVPLSQALGKSEATQARAENKGSR